MIKSLYRAEERGGGSVLMLLSPLKPFSYRYWFSRGDEVTLERIVSQCPSPTNELG